MTTWGVPFAPNHHLYKFCEAALHYECLDNWEDRAEFALGYFIQFASENGRNNAHLLAHTNDWVLMCGIYDRIPNSLEEYLEKYKKPPEQPIKRWLEKHTPFAKKGYPEFVPTEAMLRAGRVGPAYAEVIMPDWPMTLYTEFGNWTEYVKSGFRGKMVGGALVTTEKVMSEVRQVAPDLSALEKLIEKLEAKYKDRNHA
jgi:hypothetical protein